MPLRQGGTASKIRTYRTLQPLSGQQKRNMACLSLSLSHRPNLRERGNKRKVSVFERAGWLLFIGSGETENHSPGPAASRFGGSPLPRSAAPRISAAGAVGIRRRGLRYIASVVQSPLIVLLVHLGGFRFAWAYGPVCFRLSFQCFKITVVDDCQLRPSGR